MEEAQPANRSSLLVVYATVFLDLFGFGIIIPQLPFFSKALGATGATFGLLLASYSIAQLVGAPILGRLSDRYGRRPVLIGALAGQSVALFLTGWASTLVFLVTARAFAGLFGGSISTAQAYIADVTRPAERAKFMGMLGASIGLGFVLGPAVGAALVPFGFEMTAYSAAGLAAANFLFAIVALKESRPKAQRQPSLKGRLGLARVLGALSIPGMGAVLTTMFLSTFAFVAMETTFAFLGEARFDMDERDFGMILAFVGVVMVVVQGAMVGRFTDRFGEGRVAAGGAVLMAVALFATPFIPSKGLAISVMAILGAGYGFVNPTLTSLLSFHSPPETQGVNLGMGQSMAALARAVGPLIAGALYDQSLAFPYLMAGVAMMVVAVLAARLSRPTGLDQTAVESGAGG